MNIKKDNISLRAIELDDAIFLQSLINDCEIQQKTLGWSKPVSLHDQTEWIKRIGQDQSCIRFIICADNIPVGTAIISDIDYKNSVACFSIKLSGDARHKGVGTITIHMLLKYVFENLNINCVFAEILDFNIPSQKLFEKCGFRKEGVLRQRVYKNGKYNDVFIYSILVSEFASN